MKISGFTMVKNATSLYYPIRESILSILPLVDEFVVALGECRPGDTTEEEIRSIGSDKVRIVHTQWDLEKYPNGTENAHQTDIAKSHCSGDWLFYLQADEVVHEQYLPVIRARCEELLHDKQVEGLLFHYRHFWGDYEHEMTDHGWYQNEIRIVRNDAEIHSWESAQSFRRIPGFDGRNYRQQEGTYKLKVARVNAYIFHYGWVRPPHFMQNKKKSLETIHKGADEVARIYHSRPEEFDYGPMQCVTPYHGTHPEVMKAWIARFDWGHKLNYTDRKFRPGAEKVKHNRLKYRLLTWVEQNILGGRQIFTFKNFILLPGKRYRG